MLIMVRSPHFNLTNGTLEQQLCVWSHKVMEHSVWIPRGYNTVQNQDMLVEKKISHTVCDLSGLATESELLSKFIIQLNHIFCQVSKLCLLGLFLLISLLNVLQICLIQ